MTRFRHVVEIASASLPRGSAVVHFYYSPDEQRRFVSFVRDGVLAGEGVVLGCSRATYETLAPALGPSAVGSLPANLTRVEVTSELTCCVASIVETVHEVSRHRRWIRVLADFDAVTPIERIFELEATLSTALRDLPVITLTQYDGHAVPARIAIEQFRTHALTVVGNVLYNENRNYTSPEQYFHKRAAKAAG